MNKKDKIQCSHLRTKKLYVTNSYENENHSMDDSSTSQYWCLATMSTAGPDNDFAAPERCGLHRSCFKTKDII